MMIIDAWKNTDREAWIFCWLDERRLFLCVATPGYFECSCAQHFCAHVLLTRSFEDEIAPWSEELFSFYEAAWACSFSDCAVRKEEGEMCAVCFDEFAKGSACVLRHAACKRLFHFQCLNKWIPAKDSCPACGEFFSDVCRV